ncbi:hypothetical protein R6Z07M_012511 [Ovis aries]
MAMPAGRTTEIQTTTPASRVDIPASPAEALNLGAADQTSSNSVPVWQDWRAEGRRHGTCETRHGAAAAAVAFAAATLFHLSSPPTPQEAGEPPPSSSSRAGRGPLLESGCLQQTPDPVT